MDYVEEANYLVRLPDTNPTQVTSGNYINTITPWINTSSSNCSNSDDNFRVINGSTVFDHSDIIFYTIYFVLLFTLSVVNFIGNGLVIYCVLRQRKLRVPGNYFIVSLACSDLASGIVYPVYNISHMESVEIQKSIGVWGSCTVIITLTLGMLNVSSYNLVGITVTRYISIRDPLKFPHRVTHTRAVTAVILTWTLLLALACGLYLRGHPPADYKWCRYEKVLNNQPTHIFFTCIFSMIIPLVIMTLLYIYMAVIARKQARAIFTQSRRTSADALRGQMFRHELKMFRVAGMLLGYFTFAWAPFVIFEFVSIVHTSEINRYVRATVRVILHSNSAVNAFIYAGRLQEFRDAMHKETCSGKCGSQRCRGSSISADRSSVRNTALPRPHSNISNTHSIKGNSVKDQNGNKGPVDNKCKDISQNSCRGDIKVISANRIAGQLNVDKPPCNLYNQNGLSAKRKDSIQSISNETINLEPPDSVELKERKSVILGGWVNSKNIK